MAKKLANEGKSVSLHKYFFFKTNTVGQNPYSEVGGTEQLA